MKRITILVTALLLAAWTGEVLAFGISGKRIVAARGKPRPATCAQMAHAYPGTRLWQGAFLGSTEDIFDRLVKVGGVFCFVSEAECRAWIYDMQSINDGPIRANYCRPF